MQNELESAENNENFCDIELPPMYKVIFLNDDFTPMDFVVDVLINIFHKSQSEAVQIMESTHKTGRGLAGIYDYDIAATRVQLTMRKARDAGFPLMCQLERA